MILKNIQTHAGNNPWILLVICALLASCSKKEKKLPEIAVRDTTITIENSFTELFVDSVALNGFVKTTENDSIANQIQSFYNHRNYQFAWFFPDGLADFVPTFLGLQNDYIHYSGDSSLYNAQLVSRIDSLKILKKINPKDTAVLRTELLLTEQFFRYASKAYTGDHRINTQELNWFIPRKKINTEAFLDSLLKNKAQNLSAYEPVNRQYNLLKENLLNYYKIRKEETWDSLPAGKKKFKEGNRYAIIPEIKNRLFALGDLPEADSTDILDTTLTRAVRSFQARFGLKQDGQIGASFFRELNVPVQQRIQQILINMERIRWVPATPTTDYLLVNIPEYKLHVYQDGELAFNMNVVVGSEAHSTVIFSGTLNQIVFSPYWNVPPSILKNEILPGIKKNKNYLARHNMEWNGNAVRQKPGPKNSLGLVKFLFPNSYNIYLHDTPSKNLFGESSRAFSHGCIRLSEPKKLAEFLLRKDSVWTEEKITAAMNLGKEKYVRLRGKAEIPVFIGYFTVWVDQNGRLNFRKDIYGHDKKMAERLFSTTSEEIALED
ncbi:Murein L,D-transpeptidase YcbB/YkuD [Dyadobacter koreensis]|uniref:Murein L,D-transpeptidase YcbB/YkuD n=1 Tax=Dyadobacter koreensis TaxID=408657 RepID=A0A1H6XGB3_9BACT|nr:L,D-transpeptidase family protein [Dyadobacter koreensis]SEJ27176.1 Murein L,D-transpeptidase YcbB/YkuD [Dyadobacter koreensis]